MGLVEDSNVEKAVKEPAIAGDVDVGLEAGWDNVQ